MLTEHRICRKSIDALYLSKIVSLEIGVRNALNVNIKYLPIKEYDGIEYESIFNQSPDGKVVSFTVLYIALDGF